MTRNQRLLCLLLVVVAGGYFYWTGATPWFNRYQGMVNGALAQDSRNNKVQVSVRRRCQALGFNLAKVNDGCSEADVFRTFLITAKGLKEEQFDKVYLCSKGQDRFVISGSYFQRLGQEYGSQNPLYTVRTFPENVLTLQGEKAFPSWEGGVLGVTGKQMDDFNDLCHRWFITD